MTIKILVVAEHDNVSIKQSGLASIFAAVNLAKKFNDKDCYINLLLAGCFEHNNKNNLIKNITELNLINKILLADDKIFEHGLAEELSDLVINLAHDYQYIILPATSYGKNIAPRIAALLDINPLSDITEIIDERTFKRPIYAGNAVATMQLSDLDAVKVLTIRPTCFVSADKNYHNNKITKLTVGLINLNNNKKQPSKFIKYDHSESERPELASAKIIVSGGRALGSAENFNLIEKLADKLNAAVGASRAAVDAGYVPNDYQVGQTGKVVAPDLYIAIGISGAIQHIAGIRDSKVIVAINKDSEAPIFKVADYGLVGDLFTLLPELTEKITKLKEA